MKINQLLGLIRLFGLIMTLTLTVTACSSSDEQGEDLENSNENAADSQDQENQQDDQDQQQDQDQDQDQEENEEDYENEENNAGGENNYENEGGNLTQNNMNEGNMAQDNMGNMAQDNMGNMAQGNMAQGNMAGNAAPAPTGDGSRVVRFIASNDTPVYSQPDASAGSVAMMMQGDPVMVTMQGGWGMVADGRYIQSDNLSEQAVSRARPNNGWN